MVLARVGSFIMERIPEVVGVEIEDESMLLQENNVDDGDPKPVSSSYCLSEIVLNHQVLQLRLIRFRLRQRHRGDDMMFT